MAGGTDGPPLHTQLLQKLRGDVSPGWLSRSIFKVPKPLRRISARAYQPQVISIGPYHYRKGQLKKMEVCKMFYLKMLLSRRPEISLERYVTALKDKEEEARKFYSEPLDYIGGEKFVEMMLLDGCFIIEFIRKSAMKGQRDEKRDEKKHFLTPFILGRVMCDLLLVENQLPFFILSELFNMTKMPDEEAKDFKDMAIEFFSKIMPGSPRRAPEEHPDIQHLLGLLHDSCCQPPSEVHISCSPEKVIRPLCSKAKLIDIRSQIHKAKLNCCSSEVLRSSPLTSKEELDSTCAPDPNRKEWRFIRSATELREAGINFKKIGGRLFDIKFQKGVMFIPILRIDDNTESLRNLVAYEQCFEGASSKCFTNYIAFMDRLINTWKDVELLSHHGVIDNWLGDHKVVAAIFNKLCDYVFVSKEDFCYAEIFKKVNKHCDRKWNQWKAKLWHNYFNSPWGGISIFAAVFLLLLTVLQSVFSVLSYLLK